MATPVKALRYTTENREISYEALRLGLREKYFSKQDYYREIAKLNSDEKKYRKRIGAKSFNEVRSYQQDIIDEENRRRALRIAEQVRKEERRQINILKNIEPGKVTSRMGINKIELPIPGKVPITSEQTKNELAKAIIKSVEKIKKKRPTEKRRYVIRIETPNGWATLGTARELEGTKNKNEKYIADDINEWYERLKAEYDEDLEVEALEVVELITKEEAETRRKEYKEKYEREQKQFEKYAFEDDEKPKKERKQLAKKAAGRVPVKGGCDGNTHHKKVGDLKIMSPKSRNNNCLLACIHHFLQIKSENKFIYEHKRKEIGLSDGLISIDKLTDVARHYKITINLFNIGAELVNTYNAGCDKVCNLMLFIEANNLGHYVLIEGEVKLCDKCGKNWIKKHKCNLRRQMWINRMSGKRNVIPANVNREIKHDDSKMFYFDLETFKDDGTDAITPYAVGWYCNEEYQQRYGMSSWVDFYDFAIHQRDKILCAYNGSSFDFHFLLNHLLMEGEEIKDMILSNGRIMSFTFGDNIRCWDLCLFTLSPLKDACKDFKVSEDNAKTEFNHFKMTSWEKVEEYRHEVEPYLRRDVMGMKEVYEKFSDMIYDIFKVHMVEFITLSSMSYAIWTSTLNNKADFLEIPSAEKYDFIRLSLFGGRTYPMKREFTSKHYYDIVQNSENPEKLKETYNTMDDWIFNADATSLYPTAMVDFKYPMGEGKWIEKPEDISKIGFYDVDVECNQNLIVPVLPEKKPEGGISWNLKPKRGVYTSVDLENALQHGYIITKIHRGLVYEDTDDIFTDYIMKCYKIKEENEENPVKRQVGKILMNALYGKMLERARFEESKLCNNVGDVYDFMADFEVSDVQFLRDKVVLIGVPATIDIKDLRVKKPSQIGSFILAYSRRHMMNAMTAICPKLDEHFFTYTDTDSLHIHASTLPGLKEKGWLDKGLGKLSDDAKGGKIFREINLAPKLYMYLCLMPDGKIKNVMKSKGIPKQYLSPHLYENADDLDDSERVVTMKNRLKRVGLGKNINIAWRKYDAFSILSVDMERTFYKNMWEGMDYENGLWSPKK